MGLLFISRNRKTENIDEATDRTILEVKAAARKDLRLGLRSNVQQENDPKHTKEQFISKHIHVRITQS